MGLSYVQGTVRGPGGEQAVRFLIDSGAVYSLLPDPVWRAIGLVPKREMDFALADRAVGQVAGDPAGRYPPTRP